MTINIPNLNGTIRKDFAERFQILNLLEAEEDVRKMRMEAYFMTSIYLGDEKLSETWNSQALVFDCEGDPELEAAMQVIQARIGQKRYLQITTPPDISEPVEDTEMMPPIENS